MAAPMDEATRAQIQGNVWVEFTGPEFAAALADGRVERIAFCDNGIRLKVKLPDGQSATWDVADGPSADLFLSSPS